LGGRQLANRISCNPDGQGSRPAVRENRLDRKIVCRHIWVARGKAATFAFVNDGDIGHAGGKGVIYGAPCPPRSPDRFEYSSL